jgi:hypothetical protein
MVQITVDDATLAKLEGLDKLIEFRDANGKVLGRFVPITAFYRGRECPLSEEEIARRKANKGKTYTTAEVLAHLGNL